MDFGVNTDMGWENMKESKGFTLIEVIVVMAVVGIMVTIAGISLVSSSRNAELRSSSRELYSQFQRAKLESIKRNLPVAIIFVSSTRYQIFIDNNNDKVLDSGEDILADIKTKNGVAFQNINFGGDSKTGFTSRGRPTGGAGSVEIVNTVTSKKFKLTTTLAGYVHLERV